MADGSRRGTGRGEERKGRERARVRERNGFALGWDEAPVITGYVFVTFFCLTFLIVPLLRLLIIEKNNN